MNSSFLVQTYSEVLSTLEKDRANLKAAISTLENMSLSVSKDVLDQSDRIADILTIVTEVAEASSEIKRIAQGVQRLESELQGKLGPAYKILSNTMLIFRVFRGKAGCTHALDIPDRLAKTPPGHYFKASQGYRRLVHKNG